MLCAMCGKFARTFLMLRKRIMKTHSQAEFRHRFDCLYVDRTEYSGIRTLVDCLVRILESVLEQ